MEHFYIQTYIYGYPLFVVVFFFFFFLFFVGGGGGGGGGGNIRNSLDVLDVHNSIDG